MTRYLTLASKLFVFTVLMTSFSFAQAGERVVVGNLPEEATTEELKSLFTTYGEVVSVNIAKDRETGRHRGFGVVEMTSEENAQKAISTLNKTNFLDKRILVYQSRTQ
jgi:RNA recognition motif-containing protein